MPDSKDHQRQTDAHDRPRPSPAWLRAVPPWVLIALAASPSLTWFTRRLNDGGGEPYGLIPLAIALLAVIRDRKSIAASHCSRAAGLILLLVAACANGILPPMVRALLTLAGIVCWSGIHRMPGVSGLLALSLPVIASLQFYAGYPLRLAAAEGAVQLLQLAGLVATRTGLEILLGGTRVLVDPGCRGAELLWGACVLTAALSAILRCGWRHTVLAVAAVAALIVPANATRSAWHALIASGRLGTHPPSPAWADLACFTVTAILLVGWCARKTRRLESQPPAPEVRMSHRVTLLIAAGIAPILGTRCNPPSQLETPSLPRVLPFSFDGVVEILEPTPPSPEATVFSKTFPGAFSCHRLGERQVIQRQTGVATRSLHPSRDCLRAAGYDTGDPVTIRAADGGKWATFQATRQGETLTIHERVVSQQDGTIWTDIPSWYWSALDHPLNGPWRAETVIGR